MHFTYNEDTNWIPKKHHNECTVALKLWGVIMETNSTASKIAKWILLESVLKTVLIFPRTKQTPLPLYKLFFHLSLF